ncbi:hypothetical protein [Streptomyces iconiensis]|uniref:Uncharacterized protein n=1 Tax=Streptomyces iconiensis TaxID=1384038 RepID=A0ABT7A296_9ACTN|nr:hypothetical protein [Streptomyces iconiensis]MDJ1135473.1 hypothetical protein [Streptomyces iconiensis]
MSPRNHPHGRATGPGPRTPLRRQISVLRPARSAGHATCLLRRHPVPATAAPWPVPGVRGMWHVNTATRSCAGNAGTVPPAVVNATRRADALASYLGTRGLRAAGNAIYVEGGGARERATKRVFTESRLSGTGCYLHLKGAKKLSGSVRDATRVNLLSGVCLFSYRSARFLDVQGQPIPFLLPRGRSRATARLRRIVVEDELSLYEYESVVRQARVLAGLAAELPPDIPIGVTLDVPRVQYYLYLLDAFSRGQLGSGQLLHWFAHVDARHTRVARLFTDRVRAELSAARRPDVTVRCAPGLERIAAPLREAASARHLPPLDALLARLTAIDPVWEVLVRLDGGTLTPADLPEASYTVEMLRATGAHTPGENVLGIAVENFVEYRILDRAQRLRLRLEGPRPRLPALGVYPAETMVTVDTEGRPASPYLLDPGRFARDESGAMVDLFRLVEEAPS